MLGTRFDLSETLTDIAQRNVVAGAVLAEAFPVAEPQAEAVGNVLDALDVHCVELELEMAEVARLVHSRNTRISFPCPVCDARMQVSCEGALSEFGDLGVKRHDLECDTCGMTTMRAYHPAVGYSELPR